MIKIFKQPGKYSIDTTRIKIDNHLKHLEFIGEKITYFFRWIIILIELLIIFQIYLTKPNISLFRIRYIFPIFLTIGYNTFLSYILFTNKYRSYIKYISLIFDISILSVVILITSDPSFPLFSASGSVVLLYITIIALSTARINKLFTIVAVLLTLIAFNICYIIWNINYSSAPEYSIFTTSAIYPHEHQIVKSIYILFTGVIFYYITHLIKNFVIDTIRASERAINAESRLVNQYKVILNNINTGISLVDENGIILFINHTLEKLLETKRTRVIGKNIGEILNKPDKKRGYSTVQLLKRTIDRKGMIHLQLTLTSETGKKIPASIFARRTFIIKDSTYLITIIDLTHQKQLEERLLQSKKMETVGRFASGFAHDFNNLISILDENLYYGMLSPEIVDKKYLEKLKTVVEREKELVELLYRISGRFNLKEGKTRLTLSALFAKIIDLISMIIPQNIKFEIKSDIPTETPFLVNETAIMQILINLITNAKEAIGEKKGNILLTADLYNNFDAKNAILVPRKTFKQDYLVFTVSDNGPGIPEKIKKIIFEPYVSTKSPNNLPKRGLGLSFVYAIVEQLNGGIIVKSEKGKGTTFKIFIPAQRLEIESKGDTSPPDKFTMVKNRQYFAGKGADISILYIDDDEDMRLITAKILEKYGYKVYAVDNGKKALDILYSKNENRYDLIMTDFYLPDIDGKELIAKIKETSDMPIILMTGAQTEDIDSLYSNKRIDAVIKKPIEVEILIETVEKILNV